MGLKNHKLKTDHCHFYNVFVLYQNGTNVIIDHTKDHKYLSGMCNIDNESMETLLQIFGSQTECSDVTWNVHTLAAGC